VASREFEVWSTRYFRNAFFMIVHVSLAMMLIYCSFKSRSGKTEMLFSLNECRSWDSSVGIATRLRIGRSGFDFWQGLGIFLLTNASRPALGPTQPPIQWVPRALSMGVKRPEREYDHSPPSIADIKNSWSYTSLPQYDFMSWCLIKHGTYLRCI
jgi:hypothetical protein